MPYYDYDVRFVTVRDVTHISNKGPVIGVCIAEAVETVRNHAKQNGIRLRSEHIDLNGPQPYTIVFAGRDEYDWPVAYVVMITEESRNLAITPDDQGSAQTCTGH